MEKNKKHPRKEVLFFYFAIAKLYLKQRRAVLVRNRNQQLGAGLDRRRIADAVEDHDFFR